MQLVGKVGIAKWADEWDVVEDIFPICLFAFREELVEELYQVEKEWNHHPEDRQSRPVRVVLVDPVDDESLLKLSIGFIGPSNNIEGRNLVDIDISDKI